MPKTLSHRNIFLYSISLKMAKLLFISTIILGLIQTVSLGMPKLVISEAEYRAALLNGNAQLEKLIHNDQFSSK